MKILIWFLCVFVYAVVQVSFQYAGIKLGGLPTILIASFTVFGPAFFLCRLWDKRKKKNEKLRKDKVKRAELSAPSEIEPVAQATPDPRPAAFSRRAINTQFSAILTRPSRPPSAPSKPARKRPKNPTITYCKHCGKVIDKSTRKCTGCGRQRPKAKIAILCSASAISAVVVFLIVYTVINYSLATSAMYDQQFIKSQRYFDNLLIGKTIFPDEHRYISAGVLMEEGKYVDALDAFNELDGIPVPATITESLKAKIYSAGQEAYKIGNIQKANSYFNVLPSDYKRTSDYSHLLTCKILIHSRNFNVFSEDLPDLIGFEDTAEILVMTENTAKSFLLGTWTDGSERATFRDDVPSGLRISFNFPSASGSSWLRSYTITKIDCGACYCNDKKMFNISVLSKDIISVYYYDTGKTYKLHRQ